MWLTLRDTSLQEATWAVERCQGIGCTAFARIPASRNSTTGSTTGRTQAFPDTVPTAGVTYSYRVLACQATGVCSTPSNVLSALSMA